MVYCHIMDVVVSKEYCEECKRRNNLKWEAEGLPACN